MTTEQQAAYYKQQAAKHESRNKALLSITGGKVGDALKADLEELAACASPAHRHREGARMQRRPAKQQQP